MLIHIKLYKNTDFLVYPKIKVFLLVQTNIHIPRTKAINKAKNLDAHSVIHLSKIQQIYLEHGIIQTPNLD